MSARPMVLEIKRTSITRRCDCESCRLVVLPARDRIVVGAWYWRTRASNGLILCHSEAYQRLRDCAHGAGLVVGHVMIHSAGGSTPLAKHIGPGWSLDYTGPLGRPWRITVES